MPDSIAVTWLITPKGQNQPWVLGTLQLVTKETGRILVSTSL